jgi:recombination protein RecT
MENQESKQEIQTTEKKSVALSVAENQARQLVAGAKKGFEAVGSSELFAKEAQFAIQILSENDYLRKTTPDSIRNAVVNVALCGVTLNPALKLAYLVPRKGKCTLDISYMGMIELTLNSGLVKDINADVICVNDEFQAEKGTNQYLRHKAAMKDRGEMIGAYAIATLQNGEHHFEIITAEEIEKIKKTSEGLKSEYSPWKTWEAEMWKKTAVKRLFKYLKKDLNPELLAILEAEHENDKSDFQQAQDDKFSDFEIINE